MNKSVRCWALPCWPQPHSSRYPYSFIAILAIIFCIWNSPHFYCIFHIGSYSLNSMNEWRVLFGIKCHPYSSHCLPRMPFSWNTPIGYFVTWFSQALGCTVAALVAIPYFCFFVGSCWLFIFIAEDITKDLVDFNSSAKNPKTNRMKLLKQFNDVIQLYSDGKE